jgi:hypothetical protein
MRSLPKRSVLLTHVYRLALSDGKTILTSPSLVEIAESVRDALNRRTQWA